MLKIRDLKKSYGNLAVLAGLNLGVDDGEIVAVLGPSGCGKTTLLDIVAGFTGRDGGTVDSAGARVGYVFQEDRLLPWRTVAENIGIVRDDAEPGEVEGLIAQVGLRGFGGYYPAALSGGMRQRCSIARAYHYRCDLLLLDEPFKSLDYALRFEMLAMLMKVWRGRRTSILFVTHEIDDALAVASRVAVLGKRPAGVVADIHLGRTEFPRDVGDASLSAAKREIIAKLTSPSGRWRG